MRGAVNVILIMFGSAFAVALFVHFDYRRERVRIFHNFTERLSLLQRLEYFPPSAFQVRWEVGNESIYELVGNAGEVRRRVSYTIVSERPEEEGGSWLVREGPEPAEGLSLRVWRLLHEDDVRPGAEIDSFLEVSGVMTYPYVSNSPIDCDFIVESVGVEKVEVSKIPIDTVHLRTYVVGLDGRRIPFVEIWHSPLVRPLGIVKARWRRWVLILQESERHVENDRLDSVAELLEFRPTTDYSCNRCHEKKGFRTSELIAASPFVVLGDELKVSEAVYHWKKAGVQLYEEKTVKVIRPTNKADVLPYVTLTTPRGSVKLYPDSGNTLNLSFSGVNDDEYFLSAGNDCRIALVIRPVLW